MIAVMVTALLSHFRWYRRRCKGEWFFVKVDLGDRKMMFWTQDLDRLPGSHTFILGKEFYRQ